LYRLVFGIKNTIGGDKPNSRSNSPRNSPTEPLSRRDASENSSDSGSSQDGSTNSSSRSDIVARVSTHRLREERSYYICKNLTRSVDPEGNHIARPVDIVRLASLQGDKDPLVVCIYEHPGPNILHRVIDLGPAWYRAGNTGVVKDFKLEETVPLRMFLDFAVGATECLEILHHGSRIVHGEIRGDAFHMNPETGRVKLINFGSGLRTFEHGLTSSGWSSLSKEVGAKTKLSYMSPEQTGRMPAEPDSRTDIYSLGILFWTMLTQQPAFDGETPMDIIQGVLGKRLPSVSSMRMDVPDVIGRVISKMTAKNIGERYHSVSGLRHDLMEIRKLMGDGNSAALKHWQIATKDVSSFFVLPTVMIGRQKEHDEVVKIIDKVSRRHIIGQKQDVYSISSGSSLSDGVREANFDASVSVGGSSDDNTSSQGRSNSMSRDSVGMLEMTGAPSSSGQLRLSSASQHNSTESQASIRSGSMSFRPWEKNPSLLAMSSSHGGIDTRSIADSMNGEARTSSDGVGSLTNNRNSQKFRRKGRTEVVSIAGAAGLGKSCLVQSVQVEARRRGYFG